MAAMMSVDFPNCLIFIFLFLASLLYYSLFFKKPEGSRASCDLPPSPPSLPIIGHLHLLLFTLTHKSLQKLSSKYGPLLYLRIINFPIVVVSSASMANEIFKRHDVNVSTRTFTAHGDSLFFGSSGFITAPYGDYWKFMKKIVATKLLLPHAIEQSRAVRSKELERFCAILFDKAMKKESVEIGNEAMSLTNNITWRMSMGRRCSEETVRQRESENCFTSCLP